MDIAILSKKQRVATAHETSKVIACIISGHIKANQEYNVPYDSDAQLADVDEWTDSIVGLLRIEISFSNAVTKIYYKGMALLKLPPEKQPIAYNSLFEAQNDLNPITPQNTDFLIVNLFFEQDQQGNIAATSTDFVFTEKTFRDN